MVCDPQAEAVINSLTWMAETGFSLGHHAAGTDDLYWPVPPLGAFYRIRSEEVLNERENAVLLREVQRRVGDLVGAELRSCQERLRGLRVVGRDVAE